MVSICVCMVALVDSLPRVAPHPAHHEGKGRRLGQISFCRVKIAVILGWIGKSLFSGFSSDSAKKTIEDKGTEKRSAYFCSSSQDGYFFSDSNSERWDFDTDISLLSSCSRKRCVTLRVLSALPMPIFAYLR